jgi:hypothetical protein
MCKVQDRATSKKAMAAFGAAMAPEWDDPGIRSAGMGNALKQGWSSSMPLLHNAGTGKLGFMCKAVSWVEKNVRSWWGNAKGEYVGLLCFVLLTVATPHAGRQRQEYQQRVE